MGNDSEVRADGERAGESLDGTDREPESGTFDPPKPRRGRPPGSRNRAGGSDNRGGDGGDNPGTETENIPILASGLSRRRKGQKSPSDFELANGCAAVFNLVASIRGPHWAKSPDECEPIAKPLGDYLASLPARQAERIGRAFLPLSMLLGLGIVLSKPVSIELEYHRESQRVRNAETARRIAEMRGQRIAGTEGVGASNQRDGRAADDDGFRATDSLN